MFSSKELQSGQNLAAPAAGAPGAEPVPSAPATPAPADAVRPSLLRRIGKGFGDLKVRPKLIVLHNLFFLVLTCAVYFSVIPLFEQRVARAKLIEISLVTQFFSEDRPLLRLPRMASYDVREGDAAALEIPSEIRAWLDAHPGEVWQNTQRSDYLYRKDAASGLYRRITLPSVLYDEVVDRAKITLFVVLGAVYLFAVLLLELLIMPSYVYKPLTLMLDADRATRLGDRGRELISEQSITGDEIGQIMRSRNATVAQLRRQEDDLARALHQLKETAADLERKNEMLEAAKRNLEAQDRLASLGMISASVAHEMNTPLAVLHGSIEKLLETVGDRPARERLQRMQRVTQRLKKISEGLLDFARVRQREMSTVALRPLLDEAWGLVAYSEKSSQVRFSNELGAGDAVLGDADRLVQVFVNLLRNAVHALEGKGNIRAGARHFVRDGRRWLAVAIEDDGPGIPPDVLPGIFDAFVSSRLDANGTGLGLTVAEGIVQQHGGFIAAANRPGGGARLEVTLREAG
ncbi:MAG: hypothetical protein HYS04_21485 [Acidobacteria bacterium]|nr:hypothetical protein [Acidobacteriota bacterium]